MGEHIKRLNRELKFKGKIIDFYQDTIEVDGDHTVIWDFIKHKGAGRSCDRGWKDTYGQAVPQRTRPLYA